MVLTIGYGAGLAFSKAKGQIAKGGRVGFQYEGHIGMVWEKEPENRIVDINDYRH